MEKNKKSFGQIVSNFSMPILLLLLMTFGYQWLRSNFFHVSVYDIIFTLGMPLKGMSLFTWPPSSTTNCEGFSI